MCRVLRVPGSTGVGSWSLVLCQIRERVLCRVTISCMLVVCKRHTSATAASHLSCSRHVWAAWRTSTHPAPCCWCSTAAASQCQQQTQLDFAAAATSSRSLQGRLFYPCIFVCWAPGASGVWKFVPVCVVATLWRWPLQCVRVPPSRPGPLACSPRFLQALIGLPVMLSGWGLSYSSVGGCAAEPQPPKAHSPTYVGVRS